jgi:hypothetical protein
VSRTASHATEVDAGAVWHRCGAFDEVGPLREMLLSWPDLDTLRQETDGLRQFFEARGIVCHVDEPPPVRLPPRRGTGISDCIATTGGRSVYNARMTRLLFLGWFVCTGCESTKPSADSVSDADSATPASDDTAAGSGRDTSRDSGGDTDDPPDPSDCDTAEAIVTWEHFGEGFFRTYCNACHAASTENRHGAPTSVTFDTLDQVRDRADAIHRAVLEMGSMPLGGGVPDDERTLLQMFFDCGLQP